MATDFSDKQNEAEIRIARARRAKLLKKLAWIGLVIVVVLVGAGVSIYYAKRAPGRDLGQFFPDQGRDHVALGTPFSYNSNPPTSGPHFASAEEWGVYDKEIPDQVLIHNLEHGGIWIAYKPGIDAEVAKKLEGIAKEYGRKVIMTPRQANDSDIAVAAWTQLDKFSAGEFSEERVRDFIKAYRNKGPEFVP